MTLFQQQQRVPFVWVEIGGVKIPGFIDKTWYRLLQDLVAQGNSAQAATFLSQAFGEEPDEPMVIPGPPGRDGVGRDGQPVFMIGDDFSDLDMPIPGPPGAAGAAGATGVTGGTGPPGPTVYMAPDCCGDEPMVIPGPQGNQGASGLPGATMFFDDERSEPEPVFRSSVPLAPVVDQSASRSANTNYTNANSKRMMVITSVRCAITVAGGNAYVTAKSDTSTPPTTIVSSKIGIESGLLAEDNSYQIIFFVDPGCVYRLAKTTTNGTVTVGNWYELLLE